MNKVLNLINSLFKESFINRIFKIFAYLYQNSFTNKIILDISSLIRNSFIYSILTKRDEEFDLKFNFKKIINFDGNIEGIFIFISILGIYFVLKIQNIIFEIIFLFSIYIILYSLIFEKELLKNSFLYKIFSGGFYD